MKILPTIKVVRHVVLTCVILLALLVEETVAKRYEEIGNRHQGDIVLSDLQSDAANVGATQIVQDAFRWVKGIVPYEISPEFCK